MALNKTSCVLKVTNSVLFKQHRALLLVPTAAMGRKTESTAPIFCCGEQKNTLNQWLCIALIWSKAFYQHPLNRNYNPEQTIVNVDLFYFFSIPRWKVVICHVIQNKNSISDVCC